MFDGEFLYWFLRNPPSPLPFQPPPSTSGVIWCISHLLLCHVLYWRLAKEYLYMSHYELLFAWRNHCDIYHTVFFTKIIEGIKYSTVISYVSSLITYVNWRILISIFLNRSKPTVFFPTHLLGYAPWPLAEQIFQTSVITDS